MSMPRFLFVAFCVILLILPMVSEAYGQAGDCDNNGVVAAPDLVYLTAYLFTNGPVPDLVKCDCDWYPGVNYGDLWQLREFLFGTASVYASPGTDVPIPSTTDFLVLGQPDGVGLTQCVVLVRSQVAADCAIMPFTFAPGPGNADLICTSVDFTGSVCTNLQASIDNPSKVFIVSNGATPTIPVTPNWGVFCVANFALDPGGTGPGTPVTVAATSIPRVFPMLLLQKDYAGVNMVRVVSPNIMQFALINVGDCNCDGQVDIDDVVYLIQYIFQGGPPPGDPDGDGIPNC